MRFFVLGLAFLFWLPAALAQQPSNPTECLVIADQQGEDFDSAWLQQLITLDSLTQRVINERLEFSLTYNQPLLPDSMKQSILERENLQSEAKAQKFLEDYQSGDQLWAIHIKPNYSNLKPGDFWSESFGYLILRDCQVKEIWITLEMELSK